MNASRRDHRQALQPWLVAIAATAIVVLAALVSGTVDSSSQNLQFMGFDPDRSMLITALLVGAVAAAVIVLLVDRIGLATLLGALGAAAIFAPTFQAETRGAMAATGANGSFDAFGWLLTVLTLIVSGLVFAWAGAMLGRGVRPALAAAAVGIGAAARRREPEGSAVRSLVAVVVVAALLAVTLPVFSDLVNYSPDARMLHGGPPRVGLLGGGTLLPIPSLPPGQSASPSGPDASPTAVPQVWLAWKPAGLGSVSSHFLPGPWKGGTSTTAEVDVYLPPGYATSGLRYPVLYETPYSYSRWDSATNVTVALNTLIDSGAMPPAIVVAMDTTGGPYADSECANSYDGREWFDTYTAATVVPWVDAHYRTIADKRARAIIGASTGGYCAAILALHHPDVFGSSLVLSGYFHAAIDGGASNRPFGGNQAALDQASPDVVMSQLPADVRSNLFFVVDALPSQPLYGREANRFDALLTLNGYPHVLIASTAVHGWPQLRHDLALVMNLWAARMVGTGVFQLPGASPSGAPGTSG